MRLDILHKRIRVIGFPHGDSIGYCSEVNEKCFVIICHRLNCAELNGHKLYYYWKENPIIKEEFCMNEIIVEMFPKTKDAILVEKWFGTEINKPIFQLLLKGKEKEVIAEAERLEKESKSK